jgi:hypothetical protein
MVKAKDALFRAWFTGTAIPGYGTWVDWWHAQNPMKDAPAVCPGVPEGWSKTTLYEAGPTKIERRLAGRGFAAAKPLLPSLIRDTSALLPLQLLTMDDFECDQEVFAKHPRTGEFQIVKVTGVAVMDVATRRVIGLLMKPRFKDEDGKRENITRAEVRFLVYQVLRDYGIPATGQTWLVENAAAAITSELEITLRNLFGGRVQVTRTGLLHDKVLANGFIERGGKPQQKGWIESFFNLLHNEAASLPGQKGAHYQLKPGDHEDKVKYTQHLIGQGERDAQLSAEQIGRLRLPFKSADELIATYLDEIFPRIEKRLEHKMQGFEVLRRWRRDEYDTWHDWAELATLTPEERADLQWFPRELRESSRMRWERLFAQVKTTKIAEHMLAMLLLTPKSVKTRKTGITLTHNGVGYSFADKRALALRIPEGTEVLCYFDPARPSSVHVCDLAGRYLIELRSLHVNIADQAAMDDATKHLSELYNSILGTLRARPLHQEADAKLLADRAHNAAIERENESTLPAPAEAPAAARQAQPTAPVANSTTMREASTRENGAPCSPVRAFTQKQRTGVTATLARDAFAPAPTATAEATAHAILASDQARADDRRTSDQIQGDDSLDPSALL